MASTSRLGLHLTAVATLLAVLFGAAAAAMAAGEVRITVLVSYDAPPFEQALDGFKEHLVRQGAAAVYATYPLQDLSGEAGRQLEATASDGTRLILALGTPALEAAAQQAADVPIIAGMVLQEADIRRAKNASGVFLDFPIETQFAWLRRILPEARRIGVVYNPAENRGAVETAGTVAKSLGLQLVAVEVSTPAELPAALESLSNRADALWGLSDSVVVTPQTAKNLLLFSFRNRIPFIGLSAAWVKAGALYALDRDYRDIGRQCAELALMVLSGVDPGSLAPVPPRRITYSLNLKTAEQMKLEFPAALRRQAEELYQERGR